MCGDDGNNVERKMREQEEVCAANWNRGREFERENSLTPEDLAWFLSLSKQERDSLRGKTP